MNNLIKKCLLISSGGDAPGMNAAIRAVVRSAISHGITVDGSIGGFSGILEGHVKPLSKRSVGNIIQTGGTILKTARCEAFKRLEVRKKAIEFIKQQGYESILVLGGNGSFLGAAALGEEANIPTIGIPCTIDNDIVGSDYSIGFDTACNTALSAIDNIRDTAFSHNQNFIIEVMGRSSGFIAVEVGIAGGAEIILIPEFPVNIDQLNARVKQQNANKATSIIVMAEGSEPGKSVSIAQDIHKATQVEYKVCVLGHTQRGGSPTVKDRLMASMMGVQAVEALISGQTNQMVAGHQGTIILTPFPDESHSTRTFTNKQLLETNNILCDI